MDAPIQPGENTVRHGWRLRIGMLIPSVTTEAEPQIEAMLPQGVSLHSHRLKMVESTADSILSMVDKTEEGAQMLADAHVDRILFHCTAVTTYDIGMAARIKERIVKATGTPASVTADGIVAGLRAFGARRIVLVTPYLQKVNDNEVSFLKGHGFDVLSEYGLGLTYAKDFAKIEPYGWYRMAMERRDANADAYFLSCAQIRVAEIIAPLERDLGKPVITSNQAALWHCLRESGIKDQAAGFGSLWNH